jgi:glycosyltransferase involved in cell wall biosynthesis
MDFHYDRDMLLSIVVPMFNEQEGIQSSLERITAAVDSCEFDFELILVDDGSKDQTVEKVLQIAKKWQQLRLIKLRSNRGHMAAITAGLQYSRGDFVVTIDADMQDPPELICRMMEMATSQSLDVVYGTRINRNVDSWFKRKTATTYYWAMSKLTGGEIVNGAADFRLMSRSVVDELLSLNEKNRIYRLLVPWLGRKSAIVEYEREPRNAGITHYPVGSMLRLAIDSVTSFSAAPLRFATILGFFGLLVSISLAIFAVVSHSMGNTASGWTSMIITMVFIGAVQLFSIGLIGEYVARMYAELQDRPLYFAEEFDLKS